MSPSARKPAAQSSLARGLALFGLGPPRRLIDERTAPVYSRLVAGDLALDSLRHRALIPSARGNPWSVGVRFVRSADEQARSRPVVILLNGVFSDGSTWRFVTAPLAERFDLLVIDLPGTGIGACIEPDREPAHTFTPQWIGHHVWRIVSDWHKAQSAPRKLVLVGHSLAGAAILRMLGDRALRAEWSHQRACTLGAVLIGSADIGVPEWTPVLVKMAKLSEAEVSLGSVLGILKAEVEAGILRSVTYPERAAFEGEAQRIEAVMRNRHQRRASQLMLRRIRPIDERHLPVWASIRPMLLDHGRVDIPVLLLWGREDDVIPVTTAENLRSEIPGSRLTLIDEARHSVHQEEPLAVAASITRFVDDLIASEQETHAHP